MRLGDCVVVRLKSPRLGDCVVKPMFDRGLVEPVGKSRQFVSAGLRPIRIWQTGRDSTVPKKAEPAYV